MMIEGLLPTLLRAVHKPVGHKRPGGKFKKAQCRAVGWIADDGQAPFTPFHDQASSGSKGGYDDVTEFRMGGDQLSQHVVFDRDDFGFLADFGGKEGPLTHQHAKLTDEVG